MKKRPFTVAELTAARKEVQSVVARVCPAFGVDPPKTIKIFRSMLSKYHWSNSRLNIGWDSKTYIESVTLHELTHHILCQDIGPHTHVSAFWNILWEVISFYFGDHTLYAWQREYNQGKTYARNHGIQIK